MTENLKIAVRPPEYLPRLEFVAHMAAVDLFVLADTYQYGRQSFQNRSYIRTPQGRMWLSIPLERGQYRQSILNTRIELSSAWWSKHRRALRYNYSRTPFYTYYEKELAFLSAEAISLSEVTSASVAMLHRMYGMTCRLLRASKLAGCPGSLEEILEVVDPRQLVVSKASYDSDRGRFHAIDVLEFKEPAYRQHFEGFEYDISAFDALCNYGPEAMGVVKSGMANRV